MKSLKNDEWWLQVGDTNLKSWSGLEFPSAFRIFDWGVYFALERTNKRSELRSARDFRTDSVALFFAEVSIRRYYSLGVPLTFFQLHNKNAPPFLRVYQNWLGQLRAAIRHDDYRVEHVNLGFWGNNFSFCASLFSGQLTLLVLDKIVLSRNILYWENPIHFKFGAYAPHLLTGSVSVGVSNLDCKINPA